MSSRDDRHPGVDTFKETSNVMLKVMLFMHKPFHLREAAEIVDNFLGIIERKQPGIKVPCNAWDAA